MGQKKKNGKHHQGIEISSEDVEDLMSLGEEDLIEERAEFKRESETSQAEALALSLVRLPGLVRDARLRKLEREDTILFETVSYLLKRILRD